MSKPRVAIIGTGGTIASVGRHSLELVEYIDNKTIYDINDLIAQVPEVHEVADVVPVAFDAIASHTIGPPHWLQIHTLIHQLIDDDPKVDGIVITHGTASLEETAYFLNLTAKVHVPIVVVGAQRPITGLSTDGKLNLVNAARVAGCADARGHGVLVVLNDEIHAAREVSKTATLRLQTFRTPDVGVLGHADPDRIAFYRAPVRRRAPDTALSVTPTTDLPRVDIAYTYAGADGAAIDAFVQASARGIVIAGFAPGLNTRAQLAALNRASDRGVVVVQCTRVGSGRVVPLKSAHPTRAVTADNLTPQKARVLLMLALSQGTDLNDIQMLFDTH